MELPVTVGVVGLLAAPKWAALGAFAAIAADYSIEVEREHPETAEPIFTPTGSHLSPSLHTENARLSPGPRDDRSRGDRRLLQHD